MRKLHRMIDLAEFLHELFDVPSLLLELTCITHMLILTTTAGLIQRAGGFDTIWRSFQHFNQVRIRVVLKITVDTRPHPLSGNHEWHHHHPAIDTRHAHP